MKYGSEAHRIMKENSWTDCDFLSKVCFFSYLTVIGKSIQQ
jgi:hypothetical protein